MYTTKDDLLKPSSTSESRNVAVEKSKTNLTTSGKLPPYRSLVVPNNSTMSYPPVRVKEVPDLDNVQPFLSDPILGDDVGNSEFQGSRREGILTPLAKPMPYFYGSRPSIAEMIINDKVKRALATSWIFDPRACSTTAAQRHVTVPYHGLTKEEYGWIRENKFSLAAGAIKEKQDESDVAKQCLDWDKHWVTSEPYPNFNETELDQELDAFYGSGANTNTGTIDQMATNHDQQLVAFCETGEDANLGTCEQMATNHDQQLDAFYETGEDSKFGTTEQMAINHDQPEPDNDQLEPDHDQPAPNHKNFDRESMSTTWVTLPQGFRMIAGPFTSNSFHDSGVHMEDNFAEEANKDSPPQSAYLIPTEQVFHRYGKSLEKPLEGTVEDSLAQYEYSKQPASECGFEAPYDVTGFASSVSDYSEREYSSVVSDDVGINEDECSVPHPADASSLGLPVNREEFSTSQHGITHEQDINNVLDGYPHEATHNLGLPWENSSFNGGAEQGYEAEAGNTAAISQEDSSQLQVPDPQFALYNQHLLSIPNYPSEPSTQLLGDLQAHSGSSMFDNPAELQAHADVFSFENTADFQAYAGTSLSNGPVKLPVRAGTPMLGNSASFQAHAGVSSFNYPSNNAFQQHGNQQLLYPAQANVVRQEGYQNLTPEYDSDNDHNPDHREPESPATLAECAENVQNHTFAQDFNNPYDYRHYLPSDATQSSTGLNLDFNAFSQHQASIANQAILTNGSQVNFSTNAENFQINSMLAQPSLHTNVPVTNPMPSSPATLPPSSPPVLCLYPEVTPTAILRSNAPSSPAYFAPSTPTPVTMPTTDSVTPCPAPKNKIQPTHTTTWPKEEHVHTEEAESTNEAPKIPIKDVFGVQQKRKVGRPVGSKTNKKTADNTTAKRTPIPDAQAPNKRVRKSAGDAGSELKKVRGTKKDTAKTAVESSASTATATKPQTTEEAVKEKVAKHKQSPTSSEGQPKTKRVRVPSRKSLEKKAAEEEK